MKFIKVAGPDKVHTINPAMIVDMTPILKPNFPAIKTVITLADYGELYVNEPVADILGLIERAENKTPTLAPVLWQPSEIALILAGLRLLQSTRLLDLNEGVRDILEAGYTGGAAGMADAIDLLCEKVNA